MANDMQHGVACSIYVPQRHTQHMTSVQHRPLILALARVPDSTEVRGIGSWRDPKGTLHTEQVDILTCVVPSYDHVKQAFQAVASALKGLGEQKVFITVQPISFILE